MLIVGDIKQSIYRWRGGDWRLLHERAAGDLGRENTRVEVLRENWRSLPAVVAFNNRGDRRIVAADNRALNRLLGEASEGGSVDLRRPPRCTTRSPTPTADMPSSRAARRNTRVMSRSRPSPSGRPSWSASAR